MMVMDPEVPAKRAAAPLRTPEGAGAAQKMRTPSTSSAPGVQLQQQQQGGSTAKARRELQRGRQAAHSQSGLGLIKSATTTPPPPPSATTKILNNKLEVAAAAAVVNKPQKSNLDSPINDGKSLEKISPKKSISNTSLIDVTPTKTNGHHKSHGSLVEMNGKCPPVKSMPAKSSSSAVLMEAKKVPLNPTRSSPALEVKGTKAVVTRASTIPIPKTSRVTPPQAPQGVQGRPRSTSRGTRRPSKVSVTPVVPWTEVVEQAVFSKPYSTSETPNSQYVDLDVLIAAENGGGGITSTAEEQDVQEARSEEQLASERAWLEAERAWVAHRAGFSLARRLAPASPAPSDSEQDTKVRVRLEPSGLEVLVDEDDLEKANAPQFDRAEDVCQLRFLNESSAMHTLRQRYASNLIHTYAGPALLVLNPAAPIAAYSDKLALMFRGCSSEDMPPHVYAAAQAAYRALLASRRDQALVFAGRSGSGKSTNCRHAIQYLVMAAGSPVLTVERLSAVATVLEAFGSARTAHNISATRITTLYSLDVDQAGQVASANVQVLLAERSRVCSSDENELAFHVLYRLVAGAEGGARRELGLDTVTTLPNVFFTPYTKQEDRQRAAVEFSRLANALSSLGVSEAEVRALWSVLSAIIHLGAAGATKSGTATRWQFARPQSAQTAGQLMGVPVEELSRVLFSPTPSASTAPVAGPQALKELAQGLYGEVLNIVTALINRCICATAHTVASLLLLDSPGLQAPSLLHSQPSNPAGWPELCHNYLAERLQLLFYQAALQAPRDLYAQEQVTGVGDEEAPSPAPLVRLLDQPAARAATTPSRGSQPDLSRSCDRTGLLGLLDEQAVVPNGSEDLFLERLFTLHADREEQQLLSRAPGSLQFVVRHLQGSCPVLYCAENWVQAAKESPLARLAPTLLLDSQKEGVRSLCEVSRGAVGISALAGLVPCGIMDGSQSLRRASSMRRAGAGRLSAVRSILAQVDVLMETLRRANVRFVHCLLPRSGAGLCELTTYSSGNNSPITEELLDVPLLRAQLRGAQVLAAARLHKQGFPQHVPLAEFRRQFRLLAPAAEQERPLSPAPSGSGSSADSERQAVEEMLAAMENINSGSYRVGLSKVCTKPFPS